MRMIRGALHLMTASLAAWACAAIATAVPEAKIANLTVTSSVLSHGFADTYTLNAFGCTGGNVSPPLSWSGAPAGTKSFVLTLYDPDDRDNPSGWWHWVVYDIPANISALPVHGGDEGNSNLPPGAQQGRTDLGKL